MDCCEHCHNSDPEGGNPGYRRALWIVLGINTAMFLVEIGVMFRLGSSEWQATQARNMRSPRAVFPGSAVAWYGKAVSMSVVIARVWMRFIIGLHRSRLVVTPREWQTRCWARQSSEDDVFHQRGDRENEDEDKQKPHKPHPQAHSIRHVHHVVHYGGNLHGSRLLQGRRQVR
jgi:hypothetical protein